MNFLIIFDSSAGKSEILEFPDEELAGAMRARLDAELAALRQNQNREIVLLNAKNLDDLRETHARYFGDVALRAELGRLLGSRLTS